MYFDSRTTDLKVQPGKYYLADARFPLASTLLIPYRGVQYHLAEWGRADLQHVSKFYHQFCLLITWNNFHEGLVDDKIRELEESVQPVRSMLVH